LFTITEYDQWLTPRNPLDKLSDDARIAPKLLGALDVEKP